MTRRQRDADGSLSRRNVLKTVSGSVAASAVVSAGVGAGTAASGSYTGESYDGGFGSAVSYYGKYVPSTYDGSDAVPLVVMLHGCTQSADQFKDETQMNEVAEQHNFIVVYPETTEHMNDCWRWFDDSHSTRGNGEAADIAGIVDQVKSTENVDDQRVYITGLSAGGAMAPDVAVEYADVFAAAGVHSGLLYDAAESESDGSMMMSSCSSGPDPADEGQDAYDRMEQHGITSRVPQIVWHGSDDYTVYTCNGHECSERACYTNDLVDNDTDDDSIAYSSPDGTGTVSGSDMDADKTVWQDSNGDTVVEEYIVNGMGHAWSGGESGGSYTAPGGPDASQIHWDFFSRFTLDMNEAPTASISSSADVADTGQTIDFDASGSSDPDGSITSYEWDFGDGATATGSTASHSYSSTGTYTVTVTVSDDGGLSDTASTKLQVCDGDCPPIAEISASSTDVTTEDTVDFDASGSSDVDGSISTYEWDFTSDGTVDATGSTASHTYASTGTHTATVTVTDNAGQSDSASVDISVESALYCGEAENGVHVDNGRAYNSGGCYYAEGSDQYMGSCMSSTLTVLQETSSGYFEVVDSCPDGGSGGDGNTAPTADVSASSTTVTVGDTVDFDGTGSSDSDGSIASYGWDWTSDGTYDASGSTASHSWSAAGDYTVTLRVTDDDGATDTASVTVTVESSSSGYCGTEDNGTHASNGRAYSSWGYYYAEGSDQYMGYGSYDTTTLKETSDGYFEVVDSC
ncbi:PHB depolymerase family esterase [Halobacteriales archaeon Cl-PHB]